jgi:hypothetical protein
MNKDKAIHAGIKLHDFIRTNTGETADWPITISSPESGALERLDALLKEFRAAVEE